MRGGTTVSWPLLSIMHVFSTVTSIQNFNLPRQERLGGIGALAHDERPLDLHIEAR